MLGPILRGSIASLEPPQTDDLLIYRTWFADLEVTRHLATRFPPSQSQEEEWYQRQATSPTQVIWKIVADRRTIGSTGLHRIDPIHRGAKSGLMIGDRTMWGRGIASEAVQLRTAYAFEELGLERLEAESLVDNVAMHRALEKAGYRKIGRRRHALYGAGAWHDDFIFELLREDWLAGRG